jgi:hypothetical protein
MVHLLAIMGLRSRFHQVILPSKELPKLESFVHKRTADELNIHLSAAAVTTESDVEIQ